MKITLVLSGGGARGMAHIGVIEELLERGHEVVSVAGTSMGSVIGAVFALGKMEEFKDWLCSLDRKRVFGLVDFTLSSQGLIKGEKVFQKMKEFIPDRNIEDLDIPYLAVAADIINMEEVIFDKGSVYEAMRASVAIPTVFTPVKTEQGLLVDGGVMNNIPISRVKRVEGSVVVAVNVNADIPVRKPEQSKELDDEQESAYQKKLKDFYQQLQKINPFSHEEHLGYFSLVNHTINIMTNRLATLSLEKNPPDLLIETSRDACNTFDFYKAEEMVRIGRLAAIEALDLYERTTLLKDA